MSSDMIELLILFAIAAAVLYKLKSVIGTRTGFEAPPKHLQPGDERAVSDAAIRPAPIDEDPAEADDMADLTPEIRAAYEKIRKIEPNFSLGTFLKGARGAYEMIVMAYEEGDRDTLRGLLSPEIYAAFDQGITQREAEGLRVEARFIGVRNIRVEALEYLADSNMAEITLHIVGELITAVRDAENRVVEGDPNEVRRQSDVWTFARKIGSDNPNWLLSATGE